MKLPECTEISYVDFDLRTKIMILWTENFD
jgi:hypothetical protein